ncbi:MAG: GmrSD restriction endonuclease domain-containing protein [Mongoliitalea sp.]
MNNNDTAELKSDLSFLELINDKKILVPVIQRDYAQGRIDAKATEIRNNFLSAIIDNLISDESTPLLLDFIYGSTAEDNTFTPLDGQQRLTTLFLLHWYFIPKEKLPLLYQNVNGSTTSIFSYETRISSKDFCNELVQHSIEQLKIEHSNAKSEIIKKIDYLNIEPHETIDEKEKKDLISKELDSLKKQLYNTRLSVTIKNQCWFLWAWNNDPTIKAMLVMLDEIDSRLNELNENKRLDIWGKLEKGSISFHLLPLEKFELTDELYVKMNARGKELSPFDIFKSSLEEQMRINNVDETIQNKWRGNIDSNWIDLFWNKFAKNAISVDTSHENQKIIVDSVEQGFLIFLKRLIGLYFIENVSSYNYDINDANIRRLIPFQDYDDNNLKRKLMEQAIQKNIVLLFPFFYKTGFFNEDFFKYALDVFDNLIYLDENNVKHDISELIDSVRLAKENTSVFDLFVSESTDYETFLLFYAMINFCIVNKTNEIVINESLRFEFNSWMRIIRNLSTLSNTFIDDIEDFETTLNTFKIWCFEVYGINGSNSINKYFTLHPRNNVPKGRFVNDQFEEEIVKATLITNDSKWLKSINKIEEHGYFLGQIRFLLNWSKVDENYDLDKFKNFKNAIFEVFDSNGLKADLSDSETHLFRNCLMANSENYFLLKDDCLVNNTGKERDRSWKSYLRNFNKSQNIKVILDKYQLSNSQNFAEFCINEIKDGIQLITDWRRCFLKSPLIYNRCGQNQIDYWDKSKMEICLLETSKKWNGLNRHSELNSYYWSILFKDKNNWTSKYFNSQNNTPLLSEFTKEDSRVSVKFENIEREHKYVIRTNFRPTNELFTEANDHWVRIFDTDEYSDVEEQLEKLLV